MVRQVHSKMVIVVSGSAVVRDGNGANGIEFLGKNVVSFK